MDKQFITLKLSAIKPYPNNPRINDEAVQYVIKSIEECENLDPIEVDEDNVILSGHTRLKALKKLGYKQTECIRYTGLTDEQKRKYRLLANKAGEFSQWDMDLLRQELDELPDFDADFFDFSAISDDKISTKDISDTLNQCYEVIVTCSDESNQKEIYEMLSEEGYECRLSTL